MEEGTLGSGGKTSVILLFSMAHKNLEFVSSQASPGHIFLLLD